jgi:hypothetical protein
MCCTQTLECARISHVGPEVYLHPPQNGLRSFLFSARQHSVGGLLLCEGVTMKARDKAMIREMGNVIIEDLIKVIEDVQKVEKAHRKAERKARRKKAMKKAKKEHNWRAEVVEPPLSDEEWLDHPVGCDCPPCLRWEEEHAVAFDGDRIVDLVKETTAI